MDNRRLKGSVLRRQLYLEILNRETAKNEARTQAWKVCLQDFCPRYSSHAGIKPYCRSHLILLGFRDPGTEGSICQGYDMQLTIGSFHSALDCRAGLLISLWSNSAQLCGEILECGLSFPHSSTIC